VIPRRPTAAKPWAFIFYKTSPNVLMIELCVVLGVQMASVHLRNTWEKASGDHPRCYALVDTFKSTKPLSALQL
jgi:hypothetical protein